MIEDMQRQLQTYYAKAYPSQERLQIDQLTSISSGWESDVYAFAVEHGLPDNRQSHNLVLRIYPGNDASEKSRKEFRGMSQLYKAGYPVPQVHLLEVENSPFGKPFIIMDKIEGETLGDVMSTASPERQRELISVFSGLLVQLHTLEWQPYVSDPSRYDTSGNPYLFIDQWLNLMRNYLKQLPVEGLAVYLDWLEAHRNEMPCVMPTPVHLDYHASNVLLSDDGNPVVIDWTQIEISDPRFDLAWTLLLMGSHRDEERRQLILSEYERQLGAKVESLDYFDVAACLKRLGSVAISLVHGPEKLGMRPEAVEAMKAEADSLRKVYDLLVERTAIESPEIARLLTSLS